MKRILAIGMVMAAAALGETWSGTLVDVMCKGKDLSSHTRQCAIGCAKGGYGLVLADGKFYKLNETGMRKGARGAEGFVEGEGSEGEDRRGAGRRGYSGGDGGTAIALSLSLAF